MKRSWMSVVAVLILGGLPVACGGTASGTGGTGSTEASAKSASETFCAKGQECMILADGVSQQQCTQNRIDTLTALRKLPECAASADAEEDTYACAGELSCDDIKAFLTDETGTHKCYAAINALSVGMADACTRAQGGG
jgi:hypothetical protein